MTEQMKPTAEAWWKEFVEVRAWHRLSQESANLLAFCVQPAWSENGSLLLAIDCNLSMTDFEKVREVVATLRPYWPLDFWDVDKVNFDVWQRPDPEAGKVFRGKTFLPPRLGKKILAKQQLVNLTLTTSSGFLYYYDNGVFKRGGEALAVKMCQDALGDDYRENRGSEVAHWLAVKTMTDPDKANQHDGLINVANGMYCWRTGELRPHDPQYLSTIQLPIIYDPAAKCPNVEEFLLTTLPCDCIELALEWLGYMLIPSTKHQKALMLVGPGSNGKSTFIDLGARLLGNDNVTNIPLQEMAEHRFKRAELVGKLVNAFADLDASALKNSSYFKMVVGGDTIDAEKKHAHPFTFRPFARLIYSANKMPVAYDRSRAFFRRWLIVPFPNRFIGEDADPDILAKMTTPGELSGLFNLAVEGLRRLEERGRFEEPPTVAAAMDNYQQTADPLFAFLRDQCVTDVPNAEVGVVELYDAYDAYCLAEKVKYVESRRDFNTRLEQEFPEMRKLRRRRGGVNAVAVWVGGPGLAGDYQQEELDL